MEIIFEDGKARILLTAKEEAELQPMADEAGVSLQEWMQSGLLAHARKKFPAAFRKDDELDPDNAFKDWDFKD